MIELTPKQKKVLEFIQGEIQQNMPPTIREIAGHMGFSSTGTVRDYLAALQKKGYLKRTNNKSRAIELEEKLTKIPIIASIPAGKPDLAYENIEGYVDPDELYLGRLSQNDVFALKVKGQSMIDAGIRDADIAIIKKQPTAANGDIIAALIENSNEVTLKRLRYLDKKPFLGAANNRYQPIHQNFSVIGKLITIIRKY